MFKIFNSLLNKGQKVLPVCDDYDKLSDSLADFFQDKIVKIRQSLDGLNLEVDTHRHVNVNEKNSDRCRTEEDVYRILCKLPNKSCSLEIIPTGLLKQCISLIPPPLTAIINLSFKSGKFLVSPKQAIVTPIIKKASLDMNQLKKTIDQFSISNPSQKLWKSPGGKVCNVSVTHSLC